MPENLFRQAKELLDNKGGQEMTEDELKLIGVATIPLMLLPKYNDIPISIGLEELARMVEGSKSYGSESLR